MDVEQFRLYVIRPALQRTDLWSPSAENLVLGTGLQESRLSYVDQLTPGPGPAYGLFQMEAATYSDIWDNYLPSQPLLASRLKNMAGFDELAIPPVEELWGNNFFSAAMCRVHYRRVPASLPPSTYAMEMARYWKTYYNTSLGKGSVMEAYPKFALACGVTGHV